MSAEVFFLHHGWVPDEIDHINRDRQSQLLSTASIEMPATLTSVKYEPNENSAESLWLQPNEVKQGRDWVAHSLPRGTSGRCLE